MFVSGEMHDAFVHGDEDQVLVDGESEEVGVGDLFGAVETGGEGFREGPPVVGYGEEAKAGVLREIVERGRGCGEGDFAGTGSGGVAEETGFGEGADDPAEARGVEPGGDPLMVDVVLQEQSDEYVDVEEIFRVSQSRPRRTL